MKGASIYLSSQELEALEEAAGILGVLLEGTSSDAVDLKAAKTGLHSIIDKASKAAKASTRRITVKAALRAAEKD